MTRAPLRLILDAMIPGQANRWPAASDAVDLDRIAASLPPLPPAFASAMPVNAAEAQAWLARLATEDPAMMRAVTEVVYAAYYTSPSVQGVIRHLAESGPRDPSPHFDEGLLAQVRARADEQRRS